jgi:hypothetical protein
LSRRLSMAASWFCTSTFVREMLCSSWLSAASRSRSWGSSVKQAPQCALYRALCTRHYAARSSGNTALLPHLRQRLDLAPQPFELQEVGLGHNGTAVEGGQIVDAVVAQVIQDVPENGR